MQHAQIAARILNRPLLVDARRAEVMLSVLGPRIGVTSYLRADGTAVPLLSADRLDQEATIAERRLAERSYREPYLLDTSTGIAWIPVEGTLAHRQGTLHAASGVTGYDGLAARFEAAIEDPLVKGVLLDFHSGGGEVSGCFDLADRIFQAREVKPVWALANELAASAAYALASAAELIFLPRTGEVGSIGVVALHWDYSGALEAAGIVPTFIHAGAHKVDGHPFAPLADDVKADIQAEVEATRGLFAAIVARNRGLTEKAVLDTEARIYAGEAAVDAGLADAVASAAEVEEAFAEHLSKPQAPGSRRVA